MRFRVVDCTNCRKRQITENNIVGKECDKCGIWMVDIDSLTAEKMRKKGKETRIGSRYFEKGIDDYGFFTRFRTVLVPDKMLLSLVSRQIPKLEK